MIYEGSLLFTFNNQLKKIKHLNREDLKLIFSADYLNLKPPIQFYSGH